MTALEEQLTEGLAEVVRAVRDGTAAAIRAGRSPCGDASSGKAGRTKPCCSMSSGRAGRTKTLQMRIERLDGPVTGLAECLRHARRNLALTVMRQRGPDRDHGPSR